ncbi:sigma-70 family RNA polymerase sigma factor [Cellulomonas palmilytica]|uniref:sigma-70 family RNA polymerase sigma factor n=1 Tax=Cellulomonas palmilytica TaxID=2608402 RepID=UPI001F325776|nr:sigma-70 family RNA polymerase sigma factor [Cellulomonas palmilytica]UJP38808.1 sigma-70 family RNA polymerase sigma factor [Cellulomonas palmilytica]
MGRSWEPLLEHVVRERYARLLSYAVLLVGADDAPDVVQDALVSAFSGRARFTVAAEAEQYVRRAIAMRSIDTARRRRRGRALADRLASLRQEVAHLEPTTLATQVSEALAELPPRMRACVVLRHLEDLSVRDTATALGIGEGSVKRYTADGVARLAARLGTAPPDEQIRVIPAGGAS